MPMKNNQRNGREMALPTTIGIAIVLMVLLMLSITIAVTIGSVPIPVGDVYRIILGALTGAGRDSFEGMAYDIVLFIRLPRLILAMAVGMALSCSGVVMQAIVKNPMAGPYTLGISSGASLGATTAILLGFGAWFGGQAIGIFAFAGALGSALLVIVLAGIGGRTNAVRLLLSGMALGTICSAFSSFIIFIADDAEGIRDITYWLMGSVAGAKWSTNAVVVTVSLLVVIFFSTQYRTLNLMLLGDEVSITLGKNLKRYRVAYIVVVAMAVGFAVFSSGMIGFVGLLIPHIVRIFVGTDHRKTVIFSSLVGAIFLVWADVACRVVIPGSEMPIGILTSMIGGPFFIYLMVGKTYGFGGK